MAAFTAFLLLLLTSRIVLVVRDAPLTNRHALTLALAQSAALLAVAPDWRLLPLLVVIMAGNLVGAWLERRTPAHAGGYRLGVLLAVLLVAGFSFTPAHPTPLNGPLTIAVDWLREHFFYVAGLSGSDGIAIALVLIGALLVLNEANLLIRLILQFIRVVPRRNADTGSEAGHQADNEASQTLIILPPSHPAGIPQRLDQREYNAGRFIGMLERLLVYGFVLQGQYAAIGLILAAKSFARFKEMDERDFAEYVLIGTLLSVTSAAAIGELIKLLLRSGDWA